MSTSESIFRRASQARFQGGPGAEPTTVRSHWVYTAEGGTQITDVMQPDYWAGLGRRPQPWDIIEVREESGAWWAQLLVIESTCAGVHVAGIKALELDGVAPRNFVPFDEEGCTITHKGPFLKWCVTRAEGTQVQGGFEDESRAEQCLREHLYERGSHWRKYHIEENPSHTFPMKNRMTRRRR